MEKKLNKSEEKLLRQIDDVLKSGKLLYGFNETEKKYITIFQRKGLVEKEVIRGSYMLTPAGAKYLGRKYYNRMSRCAALRKSGAEVPKGCMKKDQQISVSESGIFKTSKATKKKATKKKTSKKKATKKKTSKKKTSKKTSKKSAKRSALSLCAARLGARGGKASAAKGKKKSSKKKKTSRKKSEAGLDAAIARVKRGF